MKIVLATPLYPPEIGGPATYTKELAERLRATHDVTIVAYASTSENVPDTTLVTVNKRQPLPLRLLKFTVKLYLAARGADVIYVQNGVAAGLPAVLVGKALRVPVVLKFVGDEAWERASQLRYTHKTVEEFLRKPEGPWRIRLIMMLQGFVLRHVDRITTPSRYLGAAVVKAYGIKKGRWVVNYNAAEKTEVLPFTSEPVPHQIAVTARLVEWKGIDGIIRATVLLRQTFPDVRLVIAGDGPEEEHLKELVHSLRATDFVRFAGRISRAETWYLRKASAVYVLNSEYEGLPHTALTSFAAEIPLVATDIAGTNEAVYHEQSGLLVPPHNDEALAEAIARIFNEPTLGARLVEGGKKILKEKFSWEAHLTVLLGLFDSIRPHPRN